MTEPAPDDPLAVYQGSETQVEALSADGGGGDKPSMIRRHKSSRRQRRRHKETEESNSDVVVARHQSSSSDDLSSEELKDEPTQADSPRYRQLLQRNNSRSSRRRGSVKDDDSRRRRADTPYKGRSKASEDREGDKKKRRHKKHRDNSKSRRRHKSTRALNHDDNADHCQNQDKSSDEDDSPYDIMSDIRNFEVWENEDMSTSGKKKKKKKQVDQNKEDEPHHGPCTSRKWIWIGILGFAIVIGGGLAYLFLVHPPTNNDSTPDDVQVSEKTPPTDAPVAVEAETESPSEAPSSDRNVFPSSSPTVELRFDAPSEKDCVAIQNGEMIGGQEELPVETLYMDMDITLATSGMEMTDVTTLLANQIQNVLVPEFTGCKEKDSGSAFRGRASRPDDAMKYIIANASVEAFQSANGICNSPTGSLPCFKVAVLFDLAVKANDVKYLTLYRRISSSFGEDGQSLLRKLGLEDTFQEIIVENLYLEDRSVSPTVAPSPRPSTAPPSIPPTRLPTIPPSKNPTQSPSNLSTKSPTIPPTPRPTPVPTQPPTPSPTPRSVQTSTLTFPQEIVSSNGLLSTSLSIVERSFAIPNSNIRINGRLLGGQFPGPTLRLRAGDTLQIAFSNDLSDQGLTYVHNRYSGVDDSNLHFHGLYVSGELPSDDVTYAISPGTSYDYSTDLPSNHMGGTFWMHPHRHGATAIQVGGGANSVIIVEDEPGTLPSEVENAREVIFVAQYFEVDELRRVARIAGDRVFSISGHSQNEFVTVNGQLNPTIEVDAGEWFRLRIVWVNFLQGDLDLQIDNCEMQLLAKDGVYIRDYPRRIFRAEVPSGGRADIMVRCPEASTTYNIDGIVSGFATIRTSSTDVNSASLQSWSPNYPDYLSDLRSTTPSSGCSCQTSLRGMLVNGYSYPSQESYLHTSYIGAVVQRNVEAVQHPYHQHVYPFQLVSGNSNTYFAIGDWHDVVKGRFNVRYSPDRYSGKLMIHCHRLTHEDRGMMAMEQVLDSGSCSCNYS